MTALPPSTDACRDPRVLAAIGKHPYRRIFITISGAHLYGFPSVDSDIDARGAHLLPLRQVIGLRACDETIERSVRDGAFELDFVTHDIKKFMGMMLKKNGYVLEQLHSPLVVETSLAHEELRAIAAACVTRLHHHHYLGFAATQWRLLAKHDPPRVKPLLYLYRVLLTGIHLMRTGEIEANLPRLNEWARLPWIDDLVQRKRAGLEMGSAPDATLAFHERQHHQLIEELEQASAASHLPIEPTGAAALNDLLVRIRLGAA